MNKKHWPRGSDTLGDLLAIEMLRSLDGDQPTFVPAVDISLAQQYLQQKKNDSIAAVPLLANRADRILTDELGAGSKTIDYALKWLSRLRIVGVFLVLITAIGICGTKILVSTSVPTFSVEFGVSR